MKVERKSQKLRVGWREWVSLPGLGIPAIKAKIDTGARTSALHIFNFETFRAKGRDRIRFGIHPLQKNRKVELICDAEIVDRRMVSDSSGHREMRYVIQTPIQIAGMEWVIEMTLTNRDSMLFRMLLGRTAQAGRLIIDPVSSYLTGREIGRSYKKKIKRKMKS